MRLLLIAHGSRDPRYAVSFETLCARLRQAGHQAQAGYLGLCGPDVIEAAALLARDIPGPCGEPIAAVPMFLNHGYHVAHDVPAAVATARAILVSRAAIAVCAPLGPDPLLTEAMESRLRELGVWPGDPDTAVVLASAGSSDRAARRTLDALAARWAGTGWHSVRPAFAAAARPDSAQAVAAARAAGAREVVIAGYFLAPGLLADRVATGAPGVPMGAPLITPRDVDPALLRLVLRRGGEALSAFEPLHAAGAGAGAGVGAGAVTGAAATGATGMGIGAGKDVGAAKSTGKNAAGPHTAGAGRRRAQRATR